MRLSFILFYMFSYLMIKCMQHIFVIKCIWASFCFTCFRIWWSNASNTLLSLSSFGLHFVLHVFIFDDQMQATRFCIYVRLGFILFCMFSYLMIKCMQQVFTVNCVWASFCFTYFHIWWSNARNTFLLLSALGFHFVLHVFSNQFQSC